MRGSFSDIIRQRVEESPVFKKTVIRLLSISISLGLVFSPIAYNIFNSRLFNLEGDKFFVFILIIISSVLIGACSGLLVFSKMFTHIKTVVNELSHENPRWDWLEKEYIESDIRSAYVAIKKLHFTVSSQSKLLGISQIASQVAHDIRSPLAALDLIVKDLSNIPEEQRSLIKNATHRINDIANNLLVEYKLNTSFSDELNSIENEGKELVYIVANEIFSEKRVEYRKNNIQINVSTSNQAAFSFFNMSSSLFKRVISNIINNSIEAIGVNEAIGVITISLAKINGFIEIKISDNGRGIPDDLIPLIMKDGFSYLKPGGNGIGLYHANESLKKIGGKLIIKSEVDRGTDVTIYIPSVIEPEWFLTGIYISQASKIVILDNDESTQEFLKEKLSIFIGINIYIFSSIEQLKTSAINLNNIDLFLLGNYFSESEKNVTDDIIELEIEKRAVIVTSNFNQKFLQDLCVKKGMKILPKQIIQFISQNFFYNENYYILVDDSQIVIDTWALRAIEKKINFKGFSEINLFLNFIENMDKNIHIYIDSNLENGIRGEDLAEMVYFKGFGNVYIATGYEKNNFNITNYIKDVVGKEPPF